MKPRNSNLYRTGVAAVLLAITASGVVVAKSALNDTTAQSPITASADRSASATGALAQSSLPGSFADIIQAVKPAVVNIAVKYDGVAGSDIVSPQNRELERFMRRFFPNQPGLRSIPRSMPPAESRPAQSLGSGFIISEDGWVVTNNHVIERASEIMVVMNDGEEYLATLHGSDPQTDIALLRIDADEPLPYVNFGDSDAAREGDWIIAIGNPFGLGGTTSTGIISARGRNINSGPFDDYIQFDAPINRGNSGGPLFNTQGEVIGINTAIFSPNGGSVGIGFAVPSDLAQPLLAQLQETGSVSRGYLGVHIQLVDEVLATSFGLDEPKGALVNQVVEDSPAKSAGIQAGDIILSFDGRAVDGVRDLPRIVAETDQASNVPLTIWRDGESIQLNVTVGEMQPPPTLSMNDSMQEDESFAPAKLGVQLAEINDQVRQALDLDQAASGVVIVDVLADSAADKGGLRSGDIIVSVNKEPATSPETVATAVADSAETVLLLIERDGQERFIAVPLA